MMLLKRLPSAAAVVLLAFLAGCSSGESDGTARSEPFPEQYTLMLAGGLNSSEEAEVNGVVFAAVQNRLASCMKDAGFEYRPESDPTRFQTPARSFFTKDEVNAHGYGIAAGARDVEAMGELGRNGEYVQSLDGENQAAYQEAWGEPDELGNVSGCTGDARNGAFEQLGIGDVDTPRVLDALSQVSLDARVLAADQTWRQCVADLGVETAARDLPEFVAALSEEFAEVGVGDDGAVAEFEEREKQLASDMLGCNVARNDVVVEVSSEAIAAAR